MKVVRFYTQEMGQVGFTRWFRSDEMFPTLDWSKVTAVEITEEMTLDDFKAKYPMSRFPQPAP